MVRGVCARSPMSRFFQNSTKYGTDLVSAIRNCKRTGPGLLIGVACLFVFMVVFPQIEAAYGENSAEITIANLGGPEEDYDPLSLREDLGPDDALTIIELMRSSEFADQIPNLRSSVGAINDGFGPRRNPFGGLRREFHSGIDFAGRRGDPVLASGAGVVTRAGWMGGYGNLIELDHGFGVTTRYAHLSRISVRVGEEIMRGELIGSVGSTGRSTGPHLHFEVRIDDQPVNPRFFLSLK
jgi:murein DD-endopeptidase MepM/ murein hydrolase activator NlpD